MSFIPLLFPSAVRLRSICCKKASTGAFLESTRTCLFFSFSKNVLLFHAVLVWVVVFGLFFFNGTVDRWHYHIGALGKCMLYKIISDGGKVSRKENFVYPLYSL